MIKKNNIHGIDHVGLTVPNIEEASEFFEKAFDAIVLYDTYTKDQPVRDNDFTHQRMGIPDTMGEKAIRMISLPNGPGIELFEFVGPDQGKASVPSDLGWQHVAFYVDDMEAAVEQVEAAGGKRNADPVNLSGIEEGAGNQFCYCKTPWGSSVELISYPTPQPYLKSAVRRKWSV